MGSIKKLGYVIVFVRDMGRAIAFYRDGVGLELRSESPSWTEFALEGTTLALHLSTNLGPAPAPSQDPRQKLGVAHELVFHAEDPLAVRETLLQRGVNVAPPIVVHDAGPDTVGVSCLFEDPDGNRSSVYGVVPRKALPDTDAPR